MGEAAEASQIMNMLGGQGGSGGGQQAYNLSGNYKQHQSLKDLYDVGSVVRMGWGKGPVRNMIPVNRSLMTAGLGTKSMIMRTNRFNHDLYGASVDQVPLQLATRQNSGPYMRNGMHPTLYNAMRRGGGDNSLNLGAEVSQDGARTLHGQTVIDL